jgi:endoribonuclease LACTB2
LTAGPTIFNAGYQKGNYFLIDAGAQALAFDVGWPGSLHEYGRRLRPTGKRVQDIGHLIVSHFHPDHAGLVQELKEQGAVFVVFDFQPPFIEAMERIIEKSMKHRRLVRTDNRILTIAESRRFLKTLGLAGEVVHTPGHTDDSISLLLDTGDVFTGDLQPESRLMETEVKSLDSWARLRSLGAKRVHPGHGPEFDL